MAAAILGKFEELRARYFETAENAVRKAKRPLKALCNVLYSDLETSRT